jgi:hypothetical protein
MKELPAGGREAHASLLHGLLTRLRLLAGRRNGDGHTLRETLEELIEEDEGEEGQDRAEFTEQERELLLNALSFGELQVWDVMVPRSDIQAVEATAGLADVVGTMRLAMHTRLPVYRDNLDDVVGMIHIKDLLPYWGDGAEFKLEPIIREVLFVPPSMRVFDLMLQVVCGVRRTMGSAYQAHEHVIPVSIQAVYDKLKGIEPATAAELVRDQAQQASALIDALEGARPPWLSDYRLKILDGNCLAASERRLKELRQLSAAREISQSAASFAWHGKQPLSGW